MTLDKRMYTRSIEQVLSYVKVLPSLQVLSKFEKYAYRPFNVKNASTILHLQTTLV